MKFLAIFFLSAAFLCAADSAPSADTANSGSSAARASNLEKSETVPVNSQVKADQSLHQDVKKDNAPAATDSKQVDPSVPVAPSQPSELPIKHDPEHSSTPNIHNNTNTSEIRNAPVSSTTTTVKPDTTTNPLPTPPPPPPPAPTPKPSTTTTPTPTTAAPTTAAPTTAAPTTAAPTTAAPTTAAPTTVKPSPVTTPTPKPAERHFDGPSFIGGAVLVLGLGAICGVLYMFYKARTDQNYRTLSEEPSVI